MPELKLDNFQYPILLCDVSDIQKELIPWTADYDSCNAIYEIPEEYRQSSFATIKQWPYVD